jgi:hypothetical protein
MAALVLRKPFEQDQAAGIQTVEIDQGRGDLARVVSQGGKAAAAVGHRQDAVARASQAAVRIGKESFVVIDDQERVHERISCPPPVARECVLQKRVLRIRPTIAPTAAQPATMRSETVPINRASSRTPVQPSGD